MTLPATAADRAGQRRIIVGIPAASTATLVARIATTTDPLALWALHLHLDRRGLPPCMRWPANTDTAQAEFVTLLADLLWLAKRLSAGHHAKFRGWRSLLAQAPASPAWHEHALRQYLFIAARHSIAHWCATGLDLTDAQRTDLMMMPTAGMRASRRRLQPDALAEIERRLLDHAEAHPDRAGEHTPRTVATRRLLLWRCWVLSNESPGRTAANWQCLTGEALTRQRVSTLIAQVSDIAELASRRRRSVN